jgi:hypothetical protein
VLTGKNGFRRNATAYRLANRIRSFCEFGRFAAISIGEWLPLSLNTPPSSMMRLTMVAPVRSAMAGSRRYARYALGLP